MSAQIAAIIRQVRCHFYCQRLHSPCVVAQVTASVTFLPLLDEPCAFSVLELCAAVVTNYAAGTFDLLVYTDAASAVPSEWCEQVRWLPFGVRLSARVRAQGGKRGTARVGRRGRAAAGIFNARASRRDACGVQDG